jgi:hypothetical protein
VASGVCAGSSDGAVGWAASLFPEHPDASTDALSSSANAIFIFLFICGFPPVLLYLWILLFLYKNVYVFDFFKKSVLP